VLGDREQGRAQVTEAAAHELVGDDRLHRQRRVAEQVAEAIPDPGEDGLAALLARPVGACAGRIGGLRDVDFLPLTLTTSTAAG
jgi:hypothetical protein